MDGSNPDIWECKTKKVEVRLFVFRATFSVSPLSSVKDIIVCGGESIVREHHLPTTLALTVDVVFPLNPECDINQF